MRTFGPIRLPAGALALGLAGALVALGVVMRAPVLFDYGGPWAPHQLNLVLMAHTGAYSDISHLYFRDRLWQHPAPYLDFRFEYPPAALPALLLPAYMSWSYATSFAVLMGACGAGCIAAAASALRAAACFHATRLPPVKTSVPSSTADPTHPRLFTKKRLCIRRDLPLSSGESEAWVCY